MQIIVTSLCQLKDWKTRFLDADILNEFKCLFSMYQKPLCPLQPSSMFLICATEPSLPSDPSDNVFSDVIMDCLFWYPRLCAEN